LKGQLFRISPRLHRSFPDLPGGHAVKNNAGKQVWELNDVNEEPTELNDVASQHPVGLAQMKALFDKEARANSVYPLINWSDLSVGITDFQRKAGLLPPAPAPKK
jgi:arylsulfatase